MPSVEWRAYHADGTAYPSSEYKWEDVPTEGIVLVLGSYDGQPFQASGDAIYFAGERFHELDLFHPVLEAFAKDQAEQGLLKYGVLMPDEEYEALWHRARKEHGSIDS